jgi:hypothetical protein
MLDWKVTEESNHSLSDEMVENEETRRPLSRGWYYLMIAVVVLGVATAGGLGWWRFREGERALEADLLAQIRLEESARRFGQTSRLNVLVAEDVSQQWRARFASHFRTPMGETEAVEVGIEALEIRGERAMVWVRIGSQVQRRAYRMTSGGWRRVPLESGWEGNKTSIEMQVNGSPFTLNYFEGDAVFATQLRNDLPTLFTVVEQWRERPLVLTAITIQPQELEPGVIEVYFQAEGWVTLNSPEVVQLPNHWTLNGTSAVRYALAEQILNSDPFILETDTTLPGAPQFVAATRTVVALRWALPSDEYARLVADWHVQAPESEWQSPFFLLADIPAFADPFSDTPHSAATLLVADSFINTLTAETQGEVFTHLATANHWDEFFLATTGYQTIELEDRAGGPAPVPLSLPLEAAPLPIETGNLGEMRVRVTEQNDPIVIEGLETIRLMMPNGETFPASCAPLFGDLIIEGEWQEEGRRLRASLITAPQLKIPSPFLFTAPPSDTVVYLASGVDTLIPTAEGMNSIVALTPNGERVPVLMNGTDTPLPLAIAPSPWASHGSTTGILLRLNASTPDCSGHWLLRFVPGTGITGTWLASLSNTLTTLWDDVSGRGLLIDQSIKTNTAGERGMNYWWLDEGEPQILGTPDGILPYGTIHALRPGATHITISNQNQPNNDQPILSIIDLTGATEHQFYTSPTPNAHLASAIFSPDGMNLYIGWTTASRFLESQGDGTEVTRIYLPDGDSTVWWQPDAGAIYSLFHHQQRSFLYGVAYQSTIGLRLVKFSESEVVPLSEIQLGTNIAYVQVCGNGGIFYLTFEHIEQERSNYETDLRRLYMIPADATTSEQTNAFDIRRWEYPVMCP